MDDKRNWIEIIRLPSCIICKIIVALMNMFNHFICKTVRTYVPLMNMFNHNSSNITDARYISFVLQPPRNGPRVATQVAVSNKQVSNKRV